MSEKTEQPTPKKLRDAREKGQVAQSKEVVSTALILSIFALFWGLSDFYLENFKNLILLTEDIYEMDFRQALDNMTKALFIIGVKMTLPVLVLVFFVAIIANMMQVGPLISFESLKPDIKKINPVEGAKKIFSKKSLFEVLKSLIKIAFLGGLIYYLIISHINDFLELPACGLGCALPFVGALMLKLFMYASVAFLIISVADFIFQKNQHTKQLMMSKDEVIREYKETEGDPQIKGKRKQIHQEMLNEEVKPRVKASSAIITNPTHVAVGIYYEKGEVELPVITIMDTDERAQNIKRIAREENIPIMENIPLARGLLASAEVNEYIPSEYIKPVVEVLKWVERVKAEEQDNSWE